jgi:predicted alpha/beta-hydrolase family hydrolase
LRGKAEVESGGRALSVDGGLLMLEPPVPGPRTRALAVLLHGAGSGTDVPVLRALAARLRASGVEVGRLEQPYRVAGRRMPDRAERMDAVLRAAVAALRAAGPAARAPLPLLLAGRSMGSRIACRCARDLAAAGVLAFGFPLLPPGGRPSRGEELDRAGVPVLVVQGERDSFGVPGPAPDRTVHVVAGADHVLRPRKRDGRTEAECVAEAVDVGAGWLLGLLAPRSP